MTFSIFKKLMLAFIGLTLLVLVATLGLARWSFERGFLDYVNALEEVRLEALAALLEQEYVQANRRWSGMTQLRFESIMKRHLKTFQPETFQPEALQRETLSREAFERDRYERNSGPRPGDRRGPEFQDGFAAPEVRPEPRGADHRPPPHARGSETGPRPPRMGTPTGLYTPAGAYLAGVVLEPEGEEAFISVPVTVDGQVVGELRSAPRHRFELPQEAAWSRQQWVTSSLIALVALLLAIIVSAGLSRLLLAPIRRLMERVAQMSNGDYVSRLNERRDDELGQLMMDLDRLALTLEQNQASRKRWLADISHELRTPMTVLTGTIETMKDGIRPLDMEQVLSMDQEVARLRHLIDDLYQLSLSDIGGLRYHFQPVDLGSCIRQIVASVQERAAQQGVQVLFVEDSDAASAPDVRVRADEQRLQQLFSNLLENSLRYTDAPGVISLSMRCEAERIHVVIEDTPPGVPAEDCQALFDPLYRQDSSRNRHRAGAGLGLAICRNIVLAHQGSISARPADTGGLRVDIELPE